MPYAYDPEHLPLMDFLPAPDTGATIEKPRALLMHVGGFPRYPVFAEAAIASGFTDFVKAA